MKLTIVGGGGFRVPLVYGALLAKRDRLPFDEVVLHDLDAGRMERMGGVLRGLADERGEQLPFRTTTDLDDAVEGADFVFSAIRVGRLEGRVVDETRAALARRARAGDHRPGRHLLRAAHDPRDGRRSPRRSPRMRRTPG